MSPKIILSCLLILSCLFFFAWNVRERDNHQISGLSAWKQSAKFVHIRGRKIAYFQAGTGEVLLLIHGFPSSARSWYKVMNELAKSYRVVAPDMLGFGLSDKPSPHNYTIQEQADLIIALTRALKIRHMHVIGHDYGVTVVQEILARHNAGPGKQGFLKSVALLNGGLFPEAQSFTLSQRLALTEAGPYLIRLYTKWSYDRDMRKTYGHNTGPAPFELDISWALINHKEGKKVLVELSRFKTDRETNRDRWVGALLNTRVPLILIDGVDDPLSGEAMVQRFENLVPGASTVRLHGIGHWPQLEAPEKFLRHYLEFRRKILI